MYKQKSKIKHYAKKFNFILKKLGEHPWIKHLFDFIPVYLVKSDDIPFYAFVSPDGKVFLTKGFFEFIDKGKVSCACGILAHEALHIVLNHHQVLKIYANIFYSVPFEIVRKVVNIACDAIVNDIIKECYELPDDAITFELLDKIFGEKVPRSLDELIRYLLNKSKEILDKLQVNMDLIEIGIINDFGGLSGKIGKRRAPVYIKIWFPLHSNFDPRMYYKLIKKYIDAGTIPGQMLRYLKLLEMKAKVNWRKELSKFISDKISFNYVVSWKRCSRRAIDMPGYKQLPRLKIWVLVDISGSIDKHTFHQFMAEVLGISRMRDEVEEVIAIFWDVRVRKVLKIRSLRDISKIKVRGGGGTMIFDALKYLWKNMEYNDIIVILTDGVIRDKNQKHVVQLIKKLLRKSLTFIVVTTLEPIRIPGIKNIRIK